MQVIDASGARPPAGQVTVALSSVTVTGPCQRHVAVVRNQIAVADDVADRAVGRRTGGLDQRDARGSGTLVTVLTSVFEFVPLACAWAVFVTEPESRSACVIV